MSETTPADPPLEPPQGLSFKPKKVESTGRMNSCAIIGKAKSGKTRLAASASEIPDLVKAEKKVLIMEAERGTASVADVYPNAEYFPFTNHGGFNRAIDELLTRPHDYGVVVLDTFDTFQGYAEQYFLANAGNDTRAAYGLLKKWTLETAWKLHKAPFVTIFLFHPDSVKDDRAGTVETSFKLVGSARDDIGQVFDMIAHLTVEPSGDPEKPNRVLQLGPKPGLVAGNRWEDKLPSKMVNATMPEIFRIIAGNNTTTNAAAAQQ